MEIKWEDGFEIAVSAGGGSVLVEANREGLRSLAGILLSLADGAPGGHVHLDEHNSLEDGSAELILALSGGEARS